MYVSCMCGCTFCIAISHMGRTQRGRVRGAAGHAVADRVRRWGGGKRSGTPTARSCRTGHRARRSVQLGISRRGRGRDVTLSRITYESSRWDVPKGSSLPDDSVAVYFRILDRARGRPAGDA